MKKFIYAATALLLSFAMAVPVMAADIRLKQNVVITGTKTLTVGGTSTFTGAVTMTSPLTAANIQTGSAKRQVLQAFLSPETGAAADGTVYRALLNFGRAGTVKRISYGALTAPVGGTDTLKVLKGSASGNTMLSTATVDATTLTDGAIVQGTLTSTGADLGVTAAQGVYCEYSAGTQTTDAVGVSVTVEFEPTDF